MAEKFQAMVMLGIANSRMKDFYDLWILWRGAIRILRPRSLLSNPSDLFLAAKDNPS